jgi:hypothetical protein
MRAGLRWGPVLLGLSLIVPDDYASPRRVFSGSRTRGPLPYRRPYTMDRKRPDGERLGRVMTDVVTGRDAPPARPPWPAGSARHRALVAALEGRGGRERPRLWAMAAAIAGGLAGAAAQALWPLVASHLPHAG